MQIGRTLPGAMADETQAKPDRAAEKAAARGSQSNPEREPDEVRYSVEDLMEGAQQLLGVSKHAVAGGLYGETRKTFTLAEASEAINEFLTREPKAVSG